VLKAHGVTHVFNSWDAMPPVDEQMGRVDEALSGLHIGARFLLKPGRSYRSAVEKFGPYRKVREIYEVARSAGASLIRQALKNNKRLYLYGNNRLEGCSPLTLIAILERLPEEVWQSLKGSLSS